MCLRGSGRGNGRATGGKGDPRRKKAKRREKGGRGESLEPWIGFLTVQSSRTRKPDIWTRDSCADHNRVVPRKEGAGFTVHGGEERRLPRRGGAGQNPAPLRARRITRGPRSKSPVREMRRPSLRSLPYRFPRSSRSRRRPFPFSLYYIVALRKRSPHLSFLRFRRDARAQGSCQIFVRP